MAAANSVSADEAALVAEGRGKLVGGIYDIGSGRVRFL
jgi:hypothetical protein